jgi:predicted dehydrogenase
MAPPLNYGHPGTMRSRRAAIIGCGPRAAEHVAAYGLVQRGRIVAACARTPAHAETFCREHAIEHPYDDAARMLEVEQPELLHVVTQPDQRVALLTLAAEYSIPVVVVEKPIAIQGEDWKMLTTLAATTETRFVVNTQLHFHPRLSAFRADVKEGRIGETRLIDVSAGSTISDQGVHLMELAHSFAGFADPTTVFAQMAGTTELETVQPSPDQASATITFAGGVRAHLEAGAGAPRVAPEEPFYMQKRIAVYGSRGFVHWTMFGWERLTAEDGFASGSHEYAAEDVAGQAALTDAAFALLEDTGKPHATRIERSLTQFNVVLGAYLSALRRMPVDLPCDPPDGLIASLRETLSAVW